jgi:chemotaxis protein MotB
MSDERENSQERWLVSYADFITLMFAFFAVLYATSQKDVEKSKEFQESIKRYLVKAGAFGDSGQQMNQGVKGNTPIEPPIQSYNPAKPEAAAVLDEAEKFLTDNLSKEEQKKYIQDLDSDDWGLRITLPSAAIYSGESDKFRQEAMPFISKLAGLVSQTKRKVLIEGHVSSKQTGSFKSSWELASMRSLNLLRFLQKKTGMTSDQLASASLGDSRPLYQNSDLQRNSRVEVVLLNPDFDF